MLGLFTLARLHLFVSQDPRQPFFPFGADRLGRCVFSRIMQGAQISLTVGLVGVFLSLTIGIVIGGISGYYGGRIDFALAARRRVRAGAADDPDLAGDGRRTAARLAGDAELFLYHGHPLAHRLGAARARRARAIPQPAHGGVRHRRAARRRIGSGA